MSKKGKSIASKMGGMSIIERLRIKTKRLRAEADERAMEEWAKAGFVSISKEDTDANEDIELLLRNKDVEDVEDVDSTDDLDFNDLDEESLYFLYGLSIIEVNEDEDEDQVD